MSTSFVYDAVRTPFGRYGGALSGTRPDDLAALVVGEQTRRATDLDPSRIDAAKHLAAQSASRSGFAAQSAQKEI